MQSNTNFSRSGVPAVAPVRPVSENVDPSDPVRRILAGASLEQYSKSEESSGETTDPDAAALLIAALQAGQLSIPSERNNGAGDSKNAVYDSTIGAYVEVPAGATMSNVSSPNEMFDCLWEFFKELAVLFAGITPPPISGPSRDPYADARAALDHIFALIERCPFLLPFLEAVTGYVTEAEVLELEAGGATFVPTGPIWPLARLRASATRFIEWFRFWRGCEWVVATLKRELSNAGGVQDWLSVLAALKWLADHGWPAECLSLLGDGESLHAAGTTGFLSPPGKWSDPTLPGEASGPDEFADELRGFLGIPKFPN